MRKPWLLVVAAAFQGALGPEGGPWRPPAHGAGPRAPAPWAAVPRDSPAGPGPTLRHPSAAAVPRAPAALAALLPRDPPGSPAPRRQADGRRGVLSKAAAALAAGLLVTCLGARSASAFAGEGSMRKEEVVRAAEKLTPFQRMISLEAATEPSFTGKTTNGYAHDNKKKGTYIGAISEAPIFLSSTKYDSGTGWPSFYAPVPGAVIERLDPGDLADKKRAFLMGGVRTEVIDAKSGAHLGHVFPDGPAPTGKRYCMNAGAMTFVPQ